MWLQPPQGLPMPAPIVMPELDPVTREQRWEAQAAFKTLNPRAELSNQARELEVGLKSTQVN